MLLCLHNSGLYCFEFAHFVFYFCGPISVYSFLHSSDSVLSEMNCVKREDYISSQRPSNSRCSHDSHIIKAKGTVGGGAVDRFFCTHCCVTISYLGVTEPEITGHSLLPISVFTPQFITAAHRFGHQRDFLVFHTHTFAYACIQTYSTMLTYGVSWQIYLSLSTNRLEIVL